MISLGFDDILGKHVSTCVHTRSLFSSFIALNGMQGQAIQLSHIHFSLMCKLWCSVQASLLDVDFFLTEQVRVEQLNAATKLELWQLAFESAEELYDVYNHPVQISLTRSSLDFFALRPSDSNFCVENASVTRR